VREVISIFNVGQTNINIYFSTNQITLELEDENIGSRIQFMSRLIEGEFPDYKSIIPTTYTATISFSKKELLNHLKSAAIFAGKGNEITFNLKQKENLLKITSQSEELGDYESEFKIEDNTGDNINITFNYRFLTEGLASIKDDKCVLNFSSDDGPGLLKIKRKFGFYLYINADKINLILKRN